VYKNLIGFTHFTPDGVSIRLPLVKWHLNIYLTMEAVALPKRWGNLATSGSDIAEDIIEIYRGCFNNKGGYP
jgi:hypothetical protein